MVPERKTPRNQILECDEKSVFCCFLAIFPFYVVYDGQEIYLKSIIFFCYAQRLVAFAVTEREPCDLANDHTLYIFRYIHEL